MPNKIFDELLIHHFEEFKRAFGNMSKKVFFDDKTGKLRHPGEFGIYRETICKDFLQLLIPSRLDIGQGFLMNTHDEVSTQCDIVVFDSRSTPLIQSGELQRFFPVETVCAVGEVKSTLNKTQLKQALKKLAMVKIMAEHTEYNAPIIHRTETEDYNPKNYAFDQLFSFLICQKLNFNLDNLNETQFYDKDIEHRHRHNMILSLEDGLFLYADGPNPEDDLLAYPFMNRPKRNTIFKVSTGNPDDYVRIFAHFMFMGTFNATILYPDIARYIVCEFVH